MKLPLPISLSLALVLTAGLVGCANPGIVPISEDTYLLSRTDKGGIFGNPSAMKAEVFQEAAAFAASKGKVAVPVTVRETPLVVGQRFASVEYQFRLVDKNSPAAKSAFITPRADVVIEKTETLKTDLKPAENKDSYTELLRLDDLRKRGILTEDEFTEQKRKLLAR